MSVVDVCVASYFQSLFRINDKQVQPFKFQDRLTDIDGFAAELLVAVGKPITSRRVVKKVVGRAALAARGAEEVEVVEGVMVQALNPRNGKYFNIWGHHGVN